MKAVIFDFDGTIADSFEYVFDFLLNQAKRLGKKPDENSEAYHHLPMKDVALALGIPAWRLPWVYLKGRRVIRERLLEVEPFPGMTEVIQSLHDHGYRLFIVSANSGRNVRHFLREQQLLTYFTAVRGGASLFGKAILIRQLRLRFHVKPHDCWLVGDEVLDLEAALAARVHPVMVEWGFARPGDLERLSPTKTARIPADILKLIQ